MSDFKITVGPAFAGDQFEELCKGKPSGGGWRKTAKGWARGHGKNAEYSYPHTDESGKPTGKPTPKRVKKKSLADRMLRQYVKEAGDDTGGLTDVELTQVIDYLYDQPGSHVHGVDIDETLEAALRERKSRKAGAKDIGPRGKARDFPGEEGFNRRFSDSQRRNAEATDPSQEKGGFLSDLEDEGFFDHAEKMTGKAGPRSFGEEYRDYSAHLDREQQAAKPSPKRPRPSQMTGKVRMPSRSHRSLRNVKLSTLAEPKKRTTHPEFQGEHPSGRQRPPSPYVSTHGSGNTQPRPPERTPQGMSGQMTGKQGHRIPQRTGRPRHLGIKTSRGGPKPPSEQMTGKRGFRPPVAPTRASPDTSSIRSHMERTRPQARTIKRVSEGGVHVSKMPTSGSQAGRTAVEIGEPGRSGRVSMTRSMDSQDDEFDALLKAMEKPYTGKGKRTGEPGSYKYVYDGPNATHDYTDIPEYKLRVTQEKAKEGDPPLGKGESHQEIAAKLKAGIADPPAKEADLCQAKPSVCAGNLGIIRDDMPQFDTDANPDVVKEYLQEFRDEGVKVTSGTTMKVSELKATQREIQTKKAYGMALARKSWEESMARGDHGMYDAGKFGQSDWHPAKDAVVVSSDGYILDGHHRWAAMMIASPGAPMPVHVVDAPIRTLLAKSEKFYREGRGVKKASIGAESIGVKKSMTAGQAWVSARWHERINRLIKSANARMSAGDEFDALRRL